MTELREGLQALVAAHGIGKVYVELYGRMKEDYEFLREFFGSEETLKEKAPKAKVLHVKKPPVLPAVAAQDAEASTEMSATSLKDSKIKIVKREVDPLALFPPPLHEVVAEEEAEPEVKPVLKAPKFASQKEAKAWQKEQELKKKVELEESGIVPLSLLTKANLEQWILNDSRTYAYIGREYVGLPEAVISNAAKSFNIQSEVAKKRFQVIKGKKAKQTS